MNRQWEDISGLDEKTLRPRLTTEPVRYNPRDKTTSAMPKTTTERQWVDLASEAATKPRTGLEAGGRQSRSKQSRSKRSRSKKRENRKIAEASEQLQQQIEAEEDVQDLLDMDEGDPEGKPELADQDKPEDRPKRRRSRSRSKSKFDRAESRRSTSPNRLQEALEQRANELEKEFLDEVGQEDTEMQRVGVRTGTRLEQEEAELGEDDPREQMRAQEHDDFLDGRRERPRANTQDDDDDSNWEQLTTGRRGKVRNPIAERVLRRIAGVKEPVQQDRIEDFYSLKQAKNNIKSAVSLNHDDVDQDDVDDPFLDCQEEEALQDDDADTNIDWIKLVERPKLSDEAQCANNQLAARIKRGMMTTRPPAAAPNMLPCGCEMTCSCEDATPSDVVLAREVAACGNMVDAFAGQRSNSQAIMQRPGTPYASTQTPCTPYASTQTPCTPYASTQRPCTPYATGARLRSPCSSDLEFDSDDGQYLGEDEEIRCMQRDLREGMRDDARAIRRLDPQQVKSAGAISGMVVQAQEAVAQANKLLEADPSNERAKLQLEVAQSMLRRAGPAAQAAFHHTLNFAEKDDGLDAQLEQLGVEEAQQQAALASSIPEGEEDDDLGARLDRMCDEELEQHATEAEKRAKEVERKQRRQFIAQKAQEELDKAFSAREFKQDKDMDAKIADKVVGIARPTGEEGKPLSRYEILKRRVEQAKKRAQDARDAADQAHREALAQAAQAKEDAVHAAKQAAEARLNKARQDFEAANERFSSLSRSEAEALEALTAAKTELEHLQQTLSQQEQDLEQARAEQQKTLTGGITFDDLMAFDSDCETDELDDQLSQLATTSTSIGPADAFRISQALQRSLNVQPSVYCAPDTQSNTRSVKFGPIIDLAGECPERQEKQQEEQEGDECVSIDMDDLEREASKAARAAEHAAQEAKELADHEETRAGQAVVEATRELVRCRIEAVRELVKVHSCVLSELAQAKTALACAQTAFDAAVVAYGTPEEKAVVEEKKTAPEAVVIAPPAPARPEDADAENAVADAAAQAIYGKNSRVNTTGIGAVVRDANGRLKHAVNEFGVAVATTEARQEDLDAARSSNTQFAEAHKVTMSGTAVNPTVLGSTGNEADDRELGAEVLKSKMAKQTTNRVNAAENAAKAKRGAVRGLKKMNAAMDGVKAALAAAEDDEEGDISNNSEFATSDATGSQSVRDEEPVEEEEGDQEEEEAGEFPVVNEVVDGVNHVVPTMLALPGSSKTSFSLRHTEALGGGFVQDVQFVSPLMSVLQGGESLQGGAAEFTGMSMVTEPGDGFVNTWQLDMRGNKRLVVKELPAGDEEKQRAFVIEGGFFHTDNDAVQVGFHVHVEERVQLSSETEDAVQGTYFCITEAHVGMFDSDVDKSAGARLVKGFTTLNKEEMDELKEERDQNANRFWRFVNYFVKSERTEEDLLQAKQDVEQCVGNQVLAVTDQQVDPSVEPRAISSISVPVVSFRSNDTGGLQLVMRRGKDSQNMFIGMSDGSMGVLLKGEDVSADSEHPSKHHLLTRGTGMFVGAFYASDGNFTPKLTWKVTNNSFIRTAENGDEFGCAPSESDENEMTIWMNSREAGTISGYTYKVAGLPTGDDCEVNFISGAKITGPLFAGVCGLGAELVVWDPTFRVPQLNPLMTSDPSNYNPGSYTLKQTDGKVLFESYEYVSKTSAQRDDKGTYLGGTLHDEKFGPGTYTGYEFADNKIAQVTTEDGTFVDDAFFDGWRESWNVADKMYVVQRVFRGGPLFTARLRRVDEVANVLLHGGSGLDQNLSIDESLVQDDPQLRAGFMACLATQKRLQHLTNEQHSTFKLIDFQKEDEHAFAHLVTQTQIEGMADFGFQRPDRTHDLIRLYFQHEKESMLTGPEVYLKSDNQPQTSVSSAQDLVNEVISAKEAYSSRGVENKKHEDFSDLKVHAVFIGTVESVARTDHATEAHTEMLKGRVLRSTNCQEGAFVPLFMKSKTRGTRTAAEAQLLGVRRTIEKLEKNLLDVGKAVEALQSAEKTAKLQFKDALLDRRKDGISKISADAVRKIQEAKNLYGAMQRRKSAQLEVGRLENRLASARAFLQSREKEEEVDARDVRETSFDAIFSQIMKDVRRTIVTSVDTEIREEVQRRFFFSEMNKDWENQVVKFYATDDLTSIYKTAYEHEREADEVDAPYTRQEHWSMVRRCVGIMNKWTSNLAAYLTVNRLYLLSMFTLCKQPEAGSNALFEFMLSLTRFVFKHLMSKVLDDFSRSAARQRDDDAIWQAFVDDDLRRVLDDLDHGCFLAGMRGDAWKSFKSSMGFVFKTMATSTIGSLWVGAGLAALGVATLTIAPAAIPLGTSMFLLSGTATGVMSTAAGSILLGKASVREIGDTLSGKDEAMLWQLFGAVGDVGSQLMERAKMSVDTDVTAKEDEHAEHLAQTRDADAGEMAVDASDDITIRLRKDADTMDWKRGDYEGDCSAQREEDPFGEFVFEQLGCARMFQHFTKYMCGQKMVFANEILLQQSGTHNWGTNVGNKAFHFGTGFGQTVDISLDEDTEKQTKTVAPGVQKLKKRSEVSYMGSFLFGRKDGLGIDDSEKLAMSLRSYKNLRAFGDGGPLWEAKVPARVITMLYANLPKWSLQADLFDVIWLLTELTKHDAKFRRNLYVAMRKPSDGINEGDKMRDHLTKYFKWQDRLKTYGYVTRGMGTSSLIRFVAGNGLAVALANPALAVTEVPFLRGSLRRALDDPTLNATERDRLQAQFDALNAKLTTVRQKIAIYRNVLSNFGLKPRSIDDEIGTGTAETKSFVPGTRNAARLYIMRVLLRAWVEHDWNPDPEAEKEGGVHLTPELAKKGVTKGLNSIADNFDVKAYIQGREVITTVKTERKLRVMRRISRVQDLRETQITFARQMRDTGAKVYLKVEQQFAKSEVQKKLLAWVETGNKEMIDQNEEDNLEAMKGLSKKKKMVVKSVATVAGAITGYAGSVVAASATTGLLTPIAAALTATTLTAASAGIVVVGSAALGACAARRVIGSALNYRSPEDLDKYDWCGYNAAYIENMDEFMAQEYLPALEENTHALEQIVDTYMLHKWVRKHLYRKARGASTVTENAYNGSTRMGMLHMFMGNWSTFNSVLDRMSEFDAANVALLTPEAEAPKIDPELQKIWDESAKNRKAYLEQRKDKKKLTKATLADHKKRYAASLKKAKMERAQSRANFVKDAIDARRDRAQAQMFEDNIRDLTAAMEKASSENRPDLMRQLLDLGEALGEVATNNQNAMNLDAVNQASNQVGDAVVDTYKTLVSLKVAKDLGDLSAGAMRAAVRSTINSGSMQGDFTQRVAGLAQSAADAQRELTQAILDAGALYTDTCPAFDDQQSMKSWANGMYYASVAAEGVAVAAGMGAPVLGIATGGVGAVALEAAGEAFAAAVEVAYDQQVTIQNIYDVGADAVSAWASDSSAADQAKQSMLVMSDPKVMAAQAKLADIQGQLKEAQTATKSVTAIDQGRSQQYSAAATTLDTVVKELHNNGAGLPSMNSFELQQNPLALSAVNMYTNMYADNPDNAKSVLEVFSGDLDKSKISINEDGQILVEGASQTAIFEGEDARRMFGLSDDTNVLVSLADSDADKNKIRSLWMDSNMQVGVDGDSNVILTNGKDTYTFTEQQMSNFKESTGLTTADLSKPGWWDGVKAFGGNFAKRAAFMGVGMLAEKGLKAASKTGVGKKVTGAVGTAAAAVTDGIGAVGQKVGFKATTEVAQEVGEQVVLSKKNQELLAEAVSFGVSGKSGASRMTRRSAGGALKNFKETAKLAGVLENKVADVLQDAGVEVVGRMGAMVTGAAKSAAASAADNMALKMTKAAFAESGDSVSGKLLQSTATAVAKSGVLEQTIIRGISKGVQVAGRKAFDAARAAGSSQPTFTKAQRKAFNPKAAAAVSNAIARLNLRRQGFMDVFKVSQAQAPDAMQKLQTDQERKHKKTFMSEGEEDISKTHIFRREGDLLDQVSDVELDSSSDESEISFVHVQRGDDNDHDADEQQDDLGGGEKEGEQLAVVVARFDQLFDQACQEAKNVGKAMRDEDRKEATKHARAFDHAFQSAAALLRAPALISLRSVLFEPRSRLRQLFEVCAWFYDDARKQQVEAQLDQL